MKTKNAKWVWGLVTVAAAFLGIGIYIGLHEEELRIMITNHFSANKYYYKILGVIIMDIIFPLLLLYILESDKKERVKNTVGGVALILIGQFVITIFVILNELTYSSQFMEIASNIFYLLSVFWVLYIFESFIQEKFRKNKLDD